MRHLRRVYRSLHALIHLIHGLVRARLALPAGSPPRTPRHWEIVRQWHERTLEICGIDVHVHGRRCEGPTLFVSNHVSWIDISALLTVIDAGFVGKSELRDWPVLGFLVVRGGTIFIRRGARHAISSAAEEITRRLQEGGSAAVFPEGTTTRGGSAMLPFHPALFETARRTGRPVQPVALVYDNPVAAFVDDEGFGAHFWRVLGEPRIRVDVHLLPPIDPEGHDRRSLAREAEAAVASIVRALPPPGE